MNKESLKYQSIKDMKGIRKMMELKEVLIKKDEELYYKHKSEHKPKFKSSRLPLITNKEFIPVPVVQTSKIIPPKVLTLLSPRIDEEEPEHPQHLQTGAVTERRNILRRQTLNENAISKTQQ